MYPEERRHIKEEFSRTRNLLSIIRYYLTYPILYYRLLIFLFISPKEQPEYGLSSEVDYVREKALRAGGSLLLFLTMLPMVLSTWISGLYPENGILIAIHVILKIVFTALAVASQFYNRMDMKMELYREANILSVAILVTSVLSLVLMAYVDDLLSCSLIVFQISLALGLATSLNHMITNSRDVDDLISDVATPYPTNMFFGFYSGRPFATNMILSNLIAIVFMIGGIKTALLILILIIVIFSSSGGDLDFILKLTDFRTLVFIVVGGISVAVFFLAKYNVGKNFKEKSKMRSVVAIFLFGLLLVSFVSLLYRLISVTTGSQKRWELAIFEGGTNSTSTS